MKGDLNMSHRKHMPISTDHKVYTMTARKIKKMNVNPKISRGGIRL